MSDQSLFSAAVVGGPMVRGDALVVCCGEDAEARVQMAGGLFQSGGAPVILLSGGRHKPPRWLGAVEMVSRLYALGISPDRILTDTASQNTREQAVALARMAADRGWKRLLLVASSYHMDRAYLTFLKRLEEIGHERTVQIVACPATQSPWFASPAGMTETRAELWATDHAKIVEYAEHCASYADGLAALRFWEQGPPTPLAQPAPPSVA